MRNVQRHIPDDRNINRREFVRTAGAAAAAASVAGGLPGSAFGQTNKMPPFDPPKAKSVIQIALWGGMTQFETFDPKPDADPEYRSAFKAIDTNVPGIQICELLPKLAQMADKYSILRTMFNFRTGHGDAAYPMVTGTPYPADVVSKHPTGQLIYPAVGAVVGMKQQENGRYDGEIPPWVCVDSPPFGVNEGFLGAKYKSFNVRPRLTGGGISPEKIAEINQRKALIDMIGSGASKQDRRRAAREAAELREEIFQSMTSEAQNVFDLSQESEEMLNRYGDHEFGRSCLLARRLVEYGVPFVSVPFKSVAAANGKRYGWDMHTELNDSVKALCPILDQTFSTLLSDLEERDLLDDTAITLFAENGKAPRFDDLDKKAGKVNGTKGGRGHWGKGYSVVVAGGGFQGGKAVGKMDRNGMQVEERIIYPWDMWETIYLLLGIDPHDTLPNPYGCVAYISMAEACNLPRGGLLTEII